MLLFTKENILQNVPMLPGIYLIHNKVNNKYYVGQAKPLRTRLLAHLGHFCRGNRKYPIYKAFDKYGLENFEFTILSIYEKDDPDLQIKLDNDETKYIKEYNSYGDTGYNQTYGGDAGITGYKMTDDQRKHISENSKKVANDERYKVYVYNLNTKTYEEYSTLSTLNQYYNLNIKNIRNLLNCNFLAIARSKELLEEKLQKINNTYKNVNFTNIQVNHIKQPNQYTSINYQIPNDFYEYYCAHSNKEICEKYNITLKTIYNWLKAIGKSQNKRNIHYTIPDDFVEYYYNHTQNEVCEKYNITRHTIYSWLNKLNVPSKTK